jgi:ATP-dependent helicase/nuclease subunit A
VQAGKDDFERAKVISENSDVVKIMSIHKAKGLEFPVCILANTGGIFNNKDYTGNPVMTGEGVYFDLKSDDEIGIEKTPFKKLFAEKIKSDMLSEEARILYVALTRAADRLIITGSVDNIDRFLNKNTGEQTPAGYALTGANNMLKWLAPILLDQGGKNKTDIDFDVDLVRADRLREMITTGKRTTPPTTSAPLQGGELDKTPVVGRGFPDAPQIPLLGGVAARSVDGVVLNYAETLRRMYDFEYGKDKKDLSKVPAKVLVTKLKPGILSPDQDEYAAQALKEIEMSPLPRFLEETAENIPALAGTAAHIFMQFADFEYAEVFGAQNEAENLLSKKFMTEAQYSRIKFYPIDRFFASDLYSKIKSAKRVYRETPFNLKDYVGRDDYRLIQGAIDLFFEDKDGRVYVVDFKTDQVHKPDGEKVLIRRHKYQIEYYCKAVSEILGKPVDGAYIYSFALNQAIEVI